MSRGLPISIVLHLVVFTLIAVYGTYVPQPPMETRRIMKVQITQLPDVKPQVSQPAAEPQETPPVEQPQDPVEPTPPPPQKLEPKEVPRKTQPEPRKPEPVPARPAPKEEAKPEEKPAETPITAAGPAVSGTDVDFPFAWYLNRVEGIIATKWNPRQLGFRDNDQRRCIVHFIVDRSGEVNQVTIIQSSGVPLFDREALRAVQASRLPPLPAKFTSAFLGVTFIFTLKQGL